MHAQSGELRLTVEFGPWLVLRDELPRNFSMAALAASSDSTSTHVPSVPQLLVSSSYFDEKGDLSVASLQIPLVFTNFPHDVQSRYEAFVLDICEAHGISTTTSLGSIDGAN
jgi:hypothetical protein